MSHSSFKIIANDEPISQNLVIVVNKNGSVGTDTETLQNLLTSRETPKTGVTVLRETSPTPSISEEIEEERMEQRDTLRRQYKSEHPNAEEDEIEEHLKKISGIIDIPHVSLSVENYYPPDQARKFVNDVLHLGGIDNPSTLMPIDYNFRRKIIENDHCYTPLTLSPEPSEKSIKKATKEVSSLVKGKREVKPTAKVRQLTETNDDSSDSEGAGDEDEEFDEEQSEEDEDISFSESDDDNDMDFSVNDRFGKKGSKKKRKYRRQKQKNMTFKDILEGSADLTSMDDEPKKKYGKVSKKAATSTPRPLPKASNTSTTSSKSQPSSLMKKVQAQVKNSPQIRKDQIFTSNSTFKAATTSSASSVAQVSIQSAAPVIKMSPVVKSKEREIVESIAKDLEKSYPSSPVKKPIESIPTIMQILEPNTSAEILDQSLSKLESIDATEGAENMDEIGEALIAALGKEGFDALLNQDEIIFDSQNPALKSSQDVSMISDTLSSPTSSTALSVSLNSSSLSTSAATTTANSPKILNKQAPQKDPIKIVKNGRVITLPPIEAPATRGAKRRAQGDPLPPSPAVIAVTSTSPVSIKAMRVEKTPSLKDPDSRNSSRRSSLNKSESGGGGKNSRRQSRAGDEEKNEDDIDSDASWNSEDDPDRLWCICRQPHNNRFMICCDKCEDWFHGNCVNITKAQGKQIEDKNMKWLCPNCKTGSVPIKKDPSKKPLNQQKLTKFFSKNQKESTDEDAPKMNMCVVCNKKATRTGSIFCSDECIQNHADATKQTDESSAKSGQKIGNILKDQEGKVLVYEESTRTLLERKLWPLTADLGKFLAKNPKCKPLEPGSILAEQLLANLSYKKQLSASATSSSSLQAPTISSTTPTVKTQQQIDDLFSNPAKIHTGITPTTPTTPSSTSSGNKKLPSKSSPANKSVHHQKTKPITSVSSSSPSAATKTPKVEEKKLKRQTSDEKPPPTPNSSKARIELERQNIRNNFKTTLEARMKDFDHPKIPKMSEEEIVKFAKDLELEMFIYFNRDTKDKYKNKFRSLKYNMSDVKNKTLIEKICTKMLTPKQLVTLGPAELASEELAKWREDEEKHQLEIITKSELDALTQNKIVVKTHKGEEIIETNASEITPGVDDDIESIISKNVLSLDDSHGKYDKSISLNVSGHSVTSPLSSPSISSSTSRSKSDHRRSRSRSKSHGRDHHHHHHHKSSSSSSSKHKRRSRSRSPRHHSSHGGHSHGSTRDKSRDKSRDRTKDRHDKHHRDKSKSNEHDKDKSTTKLKDNRSDAKKSTHSRGSGNEKSNKETKKREIQPEQEDVDLVGKILDSMGVHLDPKPKPAEKMEEKLPEEVTSTDPLPTAIIEPDIAVEPVNEHQLEIEIYSGSMYMADVAKFDVTASTVSGNIEDVVKKFPSTMEIVGRIEPKTVWDYLSKVKKLPGKELVVLRFSSTDEGAYFTLFSYLHTRQRYGVVRFPCETIKDFYLITVEAKRPLPPVLLPIVGPGFIEGEDHKPDLLLGVILKILPESKQIVKKSTKEVLKKKTSSRPPVEHIVPIQLLPTKHKSHHHHHHHSSGSSSNSSKLTMGLPEIKTDDLKKSSASPIDGDDEPYEPFDDGEVPTPTHYNPINVSNSSTSIASTSSKGNDDLESQVELLNKQIEARQMEIQQLAQQKAMELDEEQASRIFEKISVPHNLSEILSTINASSEPKAMDVDEDDDDDLEYVPIPAASQQGIEYRASSTYSAISNQPPIVNSMMDIDERINLFRAQEMPQPTQQQQQQPQTSRLASMSDAELLKLVPDGVFEPPPAPIISNNEPPIPGLEYDDDMDA